MDIGSLIYKFQILIAGFVGFAGVIITLLYNGKLAREQRADEARDAREQRDEERAHERHTLRAALVAELKINREAFEEDDRPLGEDQSAWVPTDSLTHAYDSYLPRLGILSKDEVDKVMLAYLMIQNYHAKLFLIGVPPPTTARHVKVPSENVQMMINMQRQLVGPIDKAVTALESADGGR